MQIPGPGPAILPEKQVREFPSEHSAKSHHTGIETNKRWEFPEAPAISQFASFPQACGKIIPDFNG
jgi:hypothetical protein